MARTTHVVPGWVTIITSCHEVLYFTFTLDDSEMIASSCGVLPYCSNLSPMQFLRILGTLLYAAKILLSV